MLYIVDKNHQIKNATFDYNIFLYFKRFYACYFIDEFVFVCDDDSFILAAAFRRKSETRVVEITRKRASTYTPWVGAAILDSNP